MKGKSALILIDQCTVDAFGQLLVGHYLAAHGVTVRYGNQGTFIAQYLRHKQEQLILIASKFTVFYNFGDRNL